MEIISRKEAILKGLKYYFTGNECNRGHISNRTVSNRKCTGCARQHYQENKEIIKQYQQENKEHRKQYSKRYNKDNKDNKDRIAKKAKQYYQENKERLAKHQSQYRLDNKDRVVGQKNKYNQENKEKVAEYKRRYYQNNKDELSKRQRERNKNNILSIFSRGTIGRLELGVGVNSKRSIKQVEMDIGYTQDQFKLHIESLWLDGMSWDNRSEWHIDHIIPIKQFIDNNIEDIMLINHLDNLQPLWAKENISKKDKRVTKHEFDEFIKNHM